MIPKNTWRKIISYCEKFGVETDLLDFESLYDNTLTEGENLNYLKSVIEDMSQNRIEGQFKIKKKSIRSEKEEKERVDLDNIRKEEDYTEKEFNKSLEELKKSKIQIIKEYEIPKDYIKSVARGFNKSFIFIGGAGCFVEGTKILTPFGKRNIEDATFVYSKGKEIEIKPCFVVPTFKQVIEIRLEDGFKIKCSPEHIFYRDNQLIQSKDLKINDYLEYYDKKELSNLWKRNRSLSFTRKEQKVLFKEVCLYWLEKKNEGKKQSLLYEEFSQRNNPIISKGNVFSKVIRSFQNQQDNNYIQTKRNGYKDKRFQRTIKNRNSETRNEGMEKEANEWESKSPIQRWFKNWTKSKQENLFTNSKTNKRMEMCELFINRQTQRLSCSSHRWKQYQQLNKKFNSFMSGLSFKTSPNKIKIKSIRITKTTQRMFDLIVPDTNNFFLENGLLVHNTGKTYLTRQILMKEKSKFIENRGVNSPLALYNFLYENNKEDLILVFDDTAGLINNPNAYSILLNVLWEGFAEWNTTSDKLKSPKKFKFNGKIIFITNKLNGENADILKSRCLVYNLKLKNKDLIKMMYIIAKQKHQELSKDERFKIVDFIKENTDNSTLNLDLRTQQKIENLFLYDEQKWEKLSKPLLDKNNDLEFLMACVKSKNTMKEAEREWVNQTGKSRRSFYAIKREIYN